MRKYYTRPCNFYYGNYAKKLIEEKKALSLAGRSNIAFDQVEVFYRKKNKLLKASFTQLKKSNILIKKYHKQLKGI